MKRDVEILSLIEKEHQRQVKGMELIASENYVSDQVMAAQGSCLTNKYAEGYPGKRYYGGCEFVDQVEELAIERAKKLFNCTYANVQPHSGSGRIAFSCMGVHCSKFIASSASSTTSSNGNSSKYKISYCNCYLITFIFNLLISELSYRSNRQ